MQPEEPTVSTGPFTKNAATVTCAATSSKFVLLGLSTGTLSLYDVFGNELDSHPALHVGPVAAVALGGGLAGHEVVASAGRARGDIRAARLFTQGFATASPDPQTSVLRGATQCLSKVCEEGVVALAVDPNFGKPRFGERVAYVDGEGKVALYTSGWFGGSEVVVAEKGEKVMDVAWVQYVLAYAYRNAVKVWDTRAKHLVCVVAAPGASRPQSPVASPAKDRGGGNEEGGSGTRSKGGTILLPESVTEASRVPVLEPSESGSLRGMADEWAMKTKIYMERDEEGAVSTHGEGTVALYVTWPTGARILKVGPHKGLESGEKTAQRDIEIAFKLDRDELFIAEAKSRGGGDVVGAVRIKNVEDAPMLSLMPFGGKEMVVLLGSATQGLNLHLISPNTGKSSRSVALPHSALYDADMLTVPGGDPLVLVVGYKATSRKATRASGDDEEDQSEEVTYVRSLTTAERVKWLLGHGRFSDALHIAQSTPGGSLRRAEVSLEDIGEQFLESLRDAGDYTRLAASLSETIATTSPYVGFRARDKTMAKRQKRWKRWINTFRQANKLAVVAPVVPTYEPCLSKETYDEILVELASSEPTVMFEVLKTWPADVFSVSTITKVIEGHLSAKDDIAPSPADREALSSGLLMMYGLSGRHDETLNLLLREESPKVYDYIRSHHLYEAVRSPETICGLYKIDPNAATDLLSHAPGTVLPPEAVVPILTKIDNSEWTFMYLHAVFRIDPDQAIKYHNQLLKLYVEHGSPGMLFHFLRTSTHYSLDRALQEMGGPKGFSNGKLADERVYVLSAMGDLNSAMDILLNEQSDTFAAIDFASDHGDIVLWERLIDHARTNADTLAALLDSPAGGKVDPVRLVPLLSSEMQIPHLRDRLHRILVDAALERALREDAAAALHHDVNQLLQSLDDSVSILQT